MSRVNNSRKANSILNGIWGGYAKKEGKKLTSKRRRQRDRGIVKKELLSLYL